MREWPRWLGCGKGPVAAAVLLPTADGRRVRRLVNSIDGPEGESLKIKTGHAYIGLSSACISVVGNGGRRSYIHRVDGTEYATSRVAKTRR